MTGQYEPAPIDIPPMGSWVELKDGQIAQVSWPADSALYTIGVLTTEGQILYPPIESLQPIPEPGTTP